MVLLGSKAPNRNVEQHDFFFGIAQDLQTLIPKMQAFWPEAGNTLHIDGWREVTRVEDYKILIHQKPAPFVPESKRLFFVNMGGYISGKLEEQHYTLLTVQNDRKSTIKTATLTDFFKSSSIKAIKSAAAHIDEKYGIDVDEVYKIEDLLTEEDKALYHITLVPAATDAQPDMINLGYLKLDKVISVKP